ncbi:hypothetical protein BpHYR1_043561 [Brachionus plicatilis]|uniref:Uncharacterized protein n=1 Tax=Brachionus plicatilis TaxID=10195 RepID=A0A3M7P780_BRAPC|nr:hypothetical protein BpHYR1_043561 [Brachionus plicatilis]
MNTFDHKTPVLSQSPTISNMNFKIGLEFNFPSSDLHSLAFFVLLLKSNTKQILGKYQIFCIVDVSINCFSSMRMTPLKRNKCFKDFLNQNIINADFLNFIQEIEFKSGILSVFNQTGYLIDLTQADISCLKKNYTLFHRLKG